MIRNWYNQIPHPALKTKRETTKYINWQQFTKGTRGKPNEQLLKKSYSQRVFRVRFVIQVNVRKVVIWLFYLMNHK